MENRSLTVADLTVFDGSKEPVLKDLKLAEAVGFAEPRKVRQLIARNRKELERRRSLAQTVTMIEVGKGAQRAVTEYLFAVPPPFLFRSH